MVTTLLSPLQQTAAIGPTDFWNDSCSIRELTYAIANGAVGATSNPTIVLAVLKKELPAWRDRIAQLISENPDSGEIEITWKLVEEMAFKASELLMPVFFRDHGRRGRISLQTNPTYYRNSQAIVDQGVRFDSLAPNIQVKVPATRAGVLAAEELTFRGVNINATVCFTIPQAIAIAEAVERGLARRIAEGKDTSNLTPVCTMMVGRLDDWIKVVAKRERITIIPGHLDWAGIAAIKKAYGIFQHRGYKTRLLAAAYRHHLHWSELVGGDVIMTIPYDWQLQFNESRVEVKERMQVPVDRVIVAELYEKFPDFRKAYDEDGMTVDEFDGYGATVRTLRTFIGSYYELLSFVRDFMLPDPDKI
ncbi:MAG: transaldolase family protein [Acidobacteria bacterium]|nr:transaldolase family protein [Acidobacteriota bacterium]MBS1865768.1 transaldolase family protein [Acidobacteriota bacterium]